MALFETGTRASVQISGGNNISNTSLRTAVDIRKVILKLLLLSGYTVGTICKIAKAVILMLFLPGVY